MITFKYSKQQELKDLAWIFSEFTFFEKLNYKVYYPNFSKELTAKLISNPSYCGKDLDSEFSNIFKSTEKKYMEALPLVSKQWKRIEKELIFILEKKFNFNTNKNIQCFISRFGPGGTFYSPSKICIRAVIENGKDIKKANQVICHELIHLLIGEDKLSKNISFENTERLVDLIVTSPLISNIIENTFIQGFGDNVVDGIFKKHSSDISKVIREIARLENDKNKSANKGI